MSDKPNIVYFHVDNLGYGELGCYGGGLLRGAATRRIDRFAKEGFQLLNYAPEAQCTALSICADDRAARDPKR
jgi:arylsulfatase